MGPQKKGSAVEAERRPESPTSEPPENGLWRTILSALESNRKTVRLISIILALAEAAEIAHTGK